MSKASPEQDQIDSKSHNRKEQYWLSHYRRWQKSGLSLAGYARSQGLVVNTFYGWHSRLKRRGLAMPEPASTVFHRITVKPTETTPAIALGQGTLLAAVKPTTTGVPASAATGLSLRFKLPNGIECEMANMTLPIYNEVLESLVHVRLR